MSYSVRVSKERKSKPEWLLTESPQIKNFDILIGWDSEFQNKEWEINQEVEKIIKEEANLEAARKKVHEIDLKRTKNSLFNDVISYQLCLYSKEKNYYIEAIIYLINENWEFEGRLKLSRILSISLELLSYKWKEVNEQKILLVAQYSIAEFSTLALSDRKTLAKNLINIQKTLVSTNFFKWPVLKYESMSKSEKARARAKNIKLLWRDTKIIAPPKANSLKNISTQTVNKKIELPEGLISNMVQLLKKDKDLYEKYAINDAIITLEFFCKFIDKYYHITSKKRVDQIPLTAVGSSELNYIKFLEFKSKEMGFEKNYLKKITFGLETNKKMLDARENDESTVNRTYLGSKNNIARYYKDYDLRRERKIAIDIDITSAYPRAFGCIPIPDWQTRWKKSVSAEEYLEDISKFYNKEADYTKLGFFDTEFTFPQKTFEPSLAQKTKWGLIYTLNGRTRATFPEMIEAKKNEAIKEGYIKELIIYRERLVNGELFFPFAEYLKEIEEERAKWPKGSFEYELYKISENGLYGKISQGIEVRKFLSLEGENEKLRPSRITCAEYASHITGIIRSTMNEIINEIERYEGCEVVHWTTDRLTFIMDLDCAGSKWKDKNYPDFEVNKDGKIIEKLSLRGINAKLWEKLENLSLVKLIKKGGEKIKAWKKWIEIQAAGDKISSETTRGNWIAWNNITQSIARAGISSNIIKNAQDFEKHVKKDEITQAAVRNLTSYKDIINNSWDLTRKLRIEKGKQGKKIYLTSFRDINIGPGGKRKISSGGINTTPFENIQEATKYREKIVYMTKKRLGKHQNK